MDKVEFCIVFLLAETFSSVSSLLKAKIEKKIPFGEKKLDRFENSLFKYLIYH